mgnify:CR=1 FL=1
MIPISWLFPPPSPSNLTRDVALHPELNYGDYCIWFWLLPFSIGFVIFMYIQEKGVNRNEHECSDSHQTPSVTYRETIRRNMANKS